MKQETQLKQQALMLKAAYEEGRQHGTNICHPDNLSPEDDCWENSTAKVMHDQLLMEAQGGINVKGNSSGI